MNILVVPGTNRCAIEIIDSISSMKDIHLYGAGSDLENNLCSKYEKYFELPDISNSQLALDELTSLLSAQNNKFDFIVFTHDEWIYKTKNFVLPKGTILLGHNEQAIEITSFKSKTYEVLAPLVPVPRVYKNKDEVSEFPVFAKPDRGQGSRGSKVLNDLTELENYLEENNSNNIISELLPGREFTIDCFSNRESRIVFSAARERLKIDGGVAIGTKTLHLEDISEMAQVISSKLQLNGAWFFQVKYDKSNTAVLIEVGLRIAGASGIERVRGFNLTAAWLYQASGIEVAVINPSIQVEVASRGNTKTIKFDRFFNKIYVDLDDTIILPDGSLNNPLILGIKEFKSSGIPISLVTRHSQDLDQTLKKFGIKALFDEIFWITDGSPKSSKMSFDGDFLFIDDSFSERYEVSKKFPDISVCVDQSVFTNYLPTQE